MCLLKECICWWKESWPHYTVFFSLFLYSVSEVQMFSLAPLFQALPPVKKLKLQTFLLLSKSVGTCKFKVMFKISKCFICGIWMLLYIHIKINKLLLKGDLPETEKLVPRRSSLYVVPVTWLWYIYFSSAYSFINTQTTIHYETCQNFQLCYCDAVYTKRSFPVVDTS